MNHPQWTVNTVNTLSLTINRRERPQSHRQSVVASSPDAHVTFICQNFSEDLANPDTVIFTAKFKDESIANDFKKAVLNAQDKM